MTALATFVIDIVWLLVEPLFWPALALRSLHSR